MDEREDVDGVVLLVDGVDHELALNDAVADAFIVGLGLHLADARQIGQRVGRVEDPLDE